MTNFATSNSSSEVSRQSRTLAIVLRWLIEPATLRSEPERRRARVLEAMTLLLLISAALYLVFVFSSVWDDRLSLYVILIVSLMVLFVLALGLNHAGHYPAAAGLIVSCTVLGTWISIALNLAALSSDFVRVSYTVVPVLLCSILLSTPVTVVLAAAQLALLFLMPRFSPVMTYTNWPSLLGFILFMSVLSVVANFISRRDLEQIDRQTRQLIENEARLRTLSVRDPLTGLFNRRYLEESLELEVRRAERTHGSIAVVMLDIDYFKHINDTAGHAAGDRVLRELSNLLSANVRGSDIACRYGGDEFVLILPDSTLDNARQKMELLLDKIKHLVVQQKDELLGAFTVSIGVAAFPAHGASAEELLKSADDALYRAKQAGRDRVVG